MQKSNIINNNLTYEQHMRINYVGIKNEIIFLIASLFTCTFLIVGFMLAVAGLDVGAGIIFIAGFIFFIIAAIHNHKVDGKIIKAIEYFEYINKKK